MLVPAKTLADAAKTAGAEAATDVTLAFGSGAGIGGDGIFGILGGAKTTTRLLDAEFPKFRQLLPASHTAVATIDSAPLLDAIKRVALVADRGAQVRMEFTEGSVLLTAGGDEAGKAEEELPVVFHGEPLTIAFNPGYLQDGLAAIGVPTVDFGFTTPSRPAVLRPSTGEEPVADEWRVSGARFGVQLPADAGAPARLIGVRPPTVVAGLPIVACPRCGVRRRAYGVGGTQRVRKDQRPRGAVLHRELAVASRHLRCGPRVTGCTSPRGSQRRSTTTAANCRWMSRSFRPVRTRWRWEPGRSAATGKSLVFCEP